MSGSMTPPELPGDEREPERIPPDWDMRLRWPPFSAIYRGGTSPHDISIDLSSPAHMPMNAHPSDPREASTRSARDCNNVLRNANSSEYFIAPAPWRRVESTMMMNTPDEYKIPWRQEAWWREIVSSNPLHFALVDHENRGLISYYASEDRATRGIRTSIKPGRYLGLYSSGMSEKTMAAHAQWFVTGHRDSRWSHEDVKFEISGEPKAFEEAYQHGPRSCMSGSILVVRNAEGKIIETDIHPAHVYGAGDLAIATLRNGSGRIAARVVVHPEKKAFSRVYPNTRSYRDDGFSSEQDSIDCVNEIVKRLRALDYKPIPEFGPRDPFIGSRILLVPANEKRNEWLMPYIDGAYSINLSKKKDDAPSEEGEWIARLTKNGMIKCQEQRGVVAFRLPDDPAGICKNCGYKIVRDQDIIPVITVPAGAKRHAKTWCRSCATLNTFQCGGNGHFYSGNVPAVTTYGGGIFNKRYVDERSHRFLKSATSGLVFDTERSGSVRMHDGTMISSEEAAAIARYCVITGHMFPITEAHKTWMNVHNIVSDERIAEWLKNEGH